MAWFCTNILLVVYYLSTTAIYEARHICVDIAVGKIMNVLGFSQLSFKNNNITTVH